MVESLSGRVCEPSSFPRERIVVGELHLIRVGLDDVLAQVGVLLAETAQELAWARVEEAARLARRALCAAVSAAPPLPTTQAAGDLVIDRLRVDPVSRRQWWGEVEVELSPLHHRLLAVMATEPYRVWAKDELLREVWRRQQTPRSAVNTSVSRLRRRLVAAGAPAGSVMLSVHGVGWALTRPA